MLEQALRLIGEQQDKLKDSPAFFVGEQLKELLRAEPEHAELVAQDLQNEKMGLAELEKKIAEEARRNKKGNMGFCSPARAEEIIREFYGLGSGRRQAPAAALDLADFL